MKFSIYNSKSIGYILIIIINNTIFSNRSKNRWRNIAKTLHDIKETSETPQKWYKGIWDFAKQTVKGDLNDSRIAKALRANSTGKALALSVASNALGEGLEDAVKREIKEEMNLVPSKITFNTSKYFPNSNTLRLSKSKSTCSSFSDTEVSLLLAKCR